MQTITVTTGFGYIKNPAGRIIAKAQLPPGKHLLLDNHSYIEVPDQQALDAIITWDDPVQTEIENNEMKIAAQSRKFAVDKLIADGELPPGYL